MENYIYFLLIGLTEFYSYAFRSVNVSCIIKISFQIKKIIRITKIIMKIFRSF